MINNHNDIGIFQQIIFHKVSIYEQTISILKLFGK